MPLLNVCVDLSILFLSLQLLWCFKIVRFDMLHLVSPRESDRHVLILTTPELFLIGLDPAAFLCLSSLFRVSSPEKAIWTLFILHRQPRPIIRRFQRYFPTLCFLVFLSAIILPLLVEFVTTPLHCRR